MKLNWIHGLLLAVTMLMCGASFALPLTDNAANSESIYDIVAFTADTADPMDVAVMPGSVILASGKYNTLATFVYLDTVPAYSVTVTACTVEAARKPLPKVPIRV